MLTMNHRLNLPSPGVAVSQFAILRCAILSSARSPLLSWKHPYKLKYKGHKPVLLEALQQGPPASTSQQCCDASPRRKPGRNPTGRCSGGCRQAVELCKQVHCITIHPGWCFLLTCMLVGRRKGKAAAASRTGSKGLPFTRCQHSRHKKVQGAVAPKTSVVNFPCSHKSIILHSHKPHHCND